MRLIRFICLAVGMAASLDSTGFAQTSSAGRKLAFLVGVTEYDHGQLANLRFTENDVTVLEGVLKSQGYQTRTLTSTAGKESIDLAPTSANIRDQLQKFLKGATKRDLIVVGLAGHGLQLTGQQSYFCPQDANPSTQGGEFSDPETLVSMEEILETLDNSGAGQKVLLVDACRNDPSVRGKRGTGGSRRGVTEVRFDALPPRTAVLLSCKGGQYAFEHESLGDGRGHGVFFNRVIKGLTAAASDNEGRVTWEDLSKYVRLEVPKDVEKLFGKDGGEQNPNVLTNLDDVAVLARVESSELVRARRPVEPLPAETEPGGANDSPESLALTDLRLRQADTFLRQAEYEHAVDAYTAIIDDVDLDLAIRKEARKGRGAAYIAKGSTSDINKALIDQTAAGLPGITLKVRSTSAELKVGNEIKGRLSQNQSVLVTRGQGEWLWVASVDGNAGLQGYVKADAVSVAESSSPRSQTGSLVAASGSINDSIRGVVLNDPLLRQADTYLRQADHDNAINAYSAIIDNTALPLEVRQEARKGRGASYLVRGSKSDINKALVDQQAAGLAGIHLTIRAASADMKVRTEVTGKLRQNQSVLVTRIEGDWLWVASVDGSDKLKGYITTNAVVAQAAQPQAQPQSNGMTQEQYQLWYQQWYQAQQQNGAVTPNKPEPKSIWETPEWETPAQIREGIRNGTLKR